MAKDLIFDGAKMIEALGDVDLATKLMSVFTIIIVVFIIFGLPHTFKFITDWRKLNFKKEKHESKSKNNGRKL